MFGNISRAIIPKFHVPSCRSSLGRTALIEGINMTAGHRTVWLGLISAGVSAALTLGGCARVTSAWSVLTAKQVSPAGPAETDDTTDVETTASPVAQGEDDLPDNSTAEASAAAANAAAAVTEVYPATAAPPVEPAKV